MTRLTTTQAGEIAALRERGWSYKRLAAKYHVSTGAIHYRCLVAGATSPRTYGRGARLGPQVIPLDNGGTLRRFTAEEDALIVQMALLGKPRSAIATALGRARSSIIVRLLTLELRDDPA